MSDRRTMKHWVIKVNGSTKADVGPGENVEIGRRPIRPVVDDGHRRLEINDKSRSVSKRHALFTVAENGGASITDLHSTNGSYVVDGEGLRRLEPDKDFIFPDSPMRLQFGDVPVDFVRIETEESEDDEQQVPDLFDYASSGAGNPDVEPHMASMSVDDILNLRAGEPTTAFSTSDVATRLQRVASSLENEVDGSSEGVPSRSVDEASVLDEEKATADDVVSKKRSESGTNPNDGRPVDRISLNVMGPETQSADVEARDLFKDAMENGLGNQTTQGVDAVQMQSASQLGETVNSGAAEKLVVDLPPQQKPAKQDSSITSRETQAQSAAQSVWTQASAQTVAPQQKGDDGVPYGVDSSALGNDSVRTGSVQQTSNLGDGAEGGRMVEDKPKATASNDERKSSPFSRSEADEVLFVPMEANSTSGGQRGDGQNTVSTAQANIDNVDATAENNTERNKFMRPVMSEADGTLSGQVVGTAETQAFKPAFEPGSVFEKVSNGEFQQKAPEVEVEGMSSDDAKRTTDFSQQFEMAKHPQLLPFLAMNPSLYGDLYEWLSAVGNDDVDAALANNSGYNEYRNKAAEGREQQ